MAKLVRNAARVLSAIKKTSGRQVVALENCRIQIPVRFSQREMAQVGADTYTYGMFSLILDSGEYAVCVVNSMMKIVPDRTTTVMIGDVPYYEFQFDAGSIVIANTDLVKRDVLIFNVFEELFIKGNIPWYIGYEDLGKIFDTARKYAGSNVAQNYEVMELIASLVARCPKDRVKYYRTCMTKYDDLTMNPAEYVPLMSVFYSVTNTVNKLAGSYFDDGIKSALVNPTTQVERIEELLRS